jgi:hypothetical protein
MPRKPPPPDPRAVKRDEKRLVGIAAKAAPRATPVGFPTASPKRGRK